MGGFITGILGVDLAWKFIPDPTGFISPFCRLFKWLDPWRHYDRRLLFYQEPAMNTKNVPHQARYFTKGITIALSALCWGAFQYTGFLRLLI